jgi:uncharacterized RDD family membrane protein YckC
MTHFHGIGRWELNATRGALSLVVLCFLLPFFTFTLSSCGGTDASQTLEVTGIQLIRHEHGPVENRTDHAPPVGRLDEVPTAADSGHRNAIAVVVLVGLGLLATLMPRRVRGGLTVAATAGVVWALFLLAGSVDVEGVDVGYDPGFVFGLLLAAAATATAAVVPFSDRPLVADPGLGRPAGFWIRLGAWVLDALVVAALGVTAVFFVGNAFGDAVPPLVTVVAVIVAYRVATEVSPLRGTVGQWTTGLEVTRADGRAVSIARSVLRAVCDLLCLVFLFGLGHAVGGLTTGKRALHDVLSGTRVGRRAPQPATATATADSPADVAPAGA